jgi:hypothetical protein
MRKTKGCRYKRYEAGRIQMILESDNKERNNRECRRGNIECCGQREGSRGDSFGGLFTFHLSRIATSGKKLAARILRHMSYMQACVEPGRRDE